MTTTGTMAVATVLVWISFLVVRPAFLRAMIEARMTEMRVHVWRAQSLVHDGKIDPDSALGEHIGKLHTISQLDATVFPGLLTFTLALVRAAKRNAKCGPDRRLHAELRGKYAPYASLIAQTFFCFTDTMRYRSLVFWGLVKLASVMGMAERGKNLLVDAISSSPPLELQTI